MNVTVGGLPFIAMKLRQLVLVVEPNDKLAQIIRTGLRSKGFEVTTAKRGSDAIRAATFTVEATGKPQTQLAVTVS